MYNFDFDKLIKWVIPWDLTKPKMVAFVSGLLSFVKQLFSDFIIYVFEKAKQIETTGQVRILQYELNQRFDAALSRIEILDAEGGTILWIYIESENQPVYLPQFISGAGYDFLVRIPIDLQNQEAFIKDFLNRYKLAGKRYQIEYF